MMLLGIIIKSLVVAAGMVFIGFLIDKFRNRKQKQQDKTEQQSDEKESTVKPGNNITITVKKSWLYVLTCGFIALIVYNIYLSEQINNLKDDIINLESSTRDTANDLHGRLTGLELGINPRYQAYRKRRLNSEYD